MNDQSSIEHKVESLLSGNDVLHKWLCERVDCRFDMLGEKENVPRWWRIFWLVSRNDGWVVGSWGFFKFWGYIRKGVRTK